jgi:GDP-L-fucose synthase
LIRKFYEAKLKNKNYVKIWGSGKATREFLHVDDLAKAVFFLIQKNIKFNYLNVGSGEWISIKKLAAYLKKISNFNGKIIFDTSKPDGQRKRSIDSSKIKNLGWKNEIKLKDGIKKLYNSYIKN